MTTMTCATSISRPSAHLPPSTRGLFADPIAHLLLCPAMMRRLSLGCCSDSLARNWVVRGDSNLLAGAAGQGHVSLLVVISYTKIFQQCGRMSPRDAGHWESIWSHATQGLTTIAVMCPTGLETWHGCRSCGWSTTWRSSRGVVAAWGAIFCAPPLEMATSHLTLTTKRGRTSERRIRCRCITLRHCCKQNIIRSTLIIHRYRG